VLGLFFDAINQCGYPASQTGLRAYKSFGVLQQQMLLMSVLQVGTARGHLLTLYLPIKQLLLICASVYRNYFKL
jgi:hypothetical protein